MKQKITYEQWQSLSEEAQQKLQAWWKLRTPPLLSIGQMIEFLQEFSKNDTNYIDNYFDHQIHGDGESGYDTSLSIGWSAYDELCDALWEACKEVLNG